MNTEQAKKVVTWLNSFANIRNAYPVRVTLGLKQEFFGAHYVSIGFYTDTMRAVTDGSHKAGDAYEQEVFFLLGERPRKFGGKTHFCFPLNGEEWYVSGWYDGESNDFHPFGNYFQLHCWPAGDQKIDTGERFHYLRVPMTTTDLE